MAAIGKGPKHQRRLQGRCKKRVLPDGIGIQACSVGSEICREMPGCLSREVDPTFFSKTKGARCDIEIFGVVEIVACQNRKIGIARMFNGPDEIDRSNGTRTAARQPSPFVQARIGRMLCGVSDNLRGMWAPLLT